MEKPNRKVNAYESLKKRVLTLDLAPGEPLDEAIISQVYGLSRTPLRDVYQRLAGEGYISIQTHKGATVSSMDLATMRNFFQSAPLIYAAIARLAAEHATMAQVSALKKTQRLFARAVSSGKASEMSMHNHRFHEQMGEIANSNYLQPSLCRLLIDHTRMSHRFYRIPKKELQGKKSINRITMSSDQHDQMIDAIQDHEPARCVDLTIQHWELSRSELNKYVLPDALPHDAVLEQ